MKQTKAVATGSAADDPVAGHDPATPAPRARQQAFPAALTETGCLSGCRPRRRHLASFRLLPAHPA